MPEQKLSIPTPGRIIGNSLEEGGVQLNCKFPEVEGDGGGGGGYFLE